MPIPLLLPLTAYAVGRAIDYFGGDAHGTILWDSLTEQYRVGPGGHGITYRVWFKHASAGSLVGATLIVRPKCNSAYIKSLHEGFADGDGDIVTGSAIARDGDDVCAMAYIPFTAFPYAQAAIVLEMAIIPPGRKAIGPLVSKPIAIDAEQFERRHALAAVCDAAIAGILMSGTVQSAHIKAAKSRIASAWSLDRHGLKLLQMGLKRACQTPIGSEWFEPDRLAADLADELESDEDRENVLEILYEIAGAQGSIGSKADRLFGEVASQLGIAGQKVQGLRARFTGDLHLQELGLTGDVDLPAIKAAYRRAVKQCHPDSTIAMDEPLRAAAADRFRRVTLAYEALVLRYRAPPQAS